MQHRDRFIQKKCEKDVDYRQAVRILQNRQNECVTMHKARILQKGRTNMLRCTERVYYRKTERMALQCTGSGANITEPYKPERVRYDLQKAARILQNRTRYNSRKNGAYHRTEK